MNAVNGYKTYLTAVGLVGYAVYQLSLGQYEQAVQTFLSAIALASVRHAISKGPEKEAMK